MALPKRDSKGRFVKSGHKAAPRKRKSSRRKK